ncbi:murein hydrolase activator EnvC family protein [Acetobacter vaccinii]|nr:peptidoglycan DD-metalloendopeptidase family protein [Acetobacter vaccinii]
MAGRRAIIAVGCLCLPLPSAWGEGKHAHHAHTAPSSPKHATQHAPRHQHPAAAPAHNPSALEQAKAAVAAVHARQQSLNYERSQQSSTVAQSRTLKEEAQARAATSRHKAAALSLATLDATTHLHDTEQQIADVDARMQATRAEQASLQTALREDTKALGPILPLAERLSLYPSDTLLAAPLAQDNAITGFLILRGLSRQMEHRAQDMRDRQDRLNTLDAELSEQKTHLAQLEQNQQQQRSLVSQQAAQARRAQKQADADARQAVRQLQLATQRAATLQDAIARLDAMETAAKTTMQQELDAETRRQEEARALARRQAALAQAQAAARTQAAARHTAPPPATPTQQVAPATAQTADDTPDSGAGIGHALRPVAGILVTAWGSQTESGPATGMTYRTPSSASVRAPCTGSVDFAGSFRTYGQMVILNCGQHYRFVLAGLSALSVDTGQTLAKGAPVGRMGAADSATRLFLQLRHGQKTVNPASYL